MEITIKDKKIELVEPAHVDKKFLQETKYALKVLPNAVVRAPLFFGIGAASSTFIPMDETSKLILLTFSLAALIGGGTLTALKNHYNSPEKEKFFENENCAYFESFITKRFKSLAKLEKAKRANNIEKIEEKQTDLIEDTARVLLNYIEQFDQCLSEIKKAFNDYIFENNVEGDDFRRVKYEAAEYRAQPEKDKFYLLKILGDNLDLFDFCSTSTKSRIMTNMTEYEKYLINNISAQTALAAPEFNGNSDMVKSWFKMDMEMIEEDSGIFEEFAKPDAYYDYFLEQDNGDVKNQIARIDKFDADLKEQRELNPEEDDLSVFCDDIRELF